MSRETNTGRTVKIVSSWGDSLVHRSVDGNSITIFKRDGGKITKETNQKGRGQKTKSEVFEQDELFGPDHDYAIKVNADVNLFVSARERQESKSRPDQSISVDKTKEKGV